MVRGGLGERGAERWGVAAWEGQGWRPGGGRLLGEEERSRNAAGSGDWSVGVNRVIQRCAPLIAEQLARDAVKRSEVQVGLRCA